MSVGFGDIITAIKILHGAVEILRARHGAEAEYANIIEDIESYEGTLAHLQHLKLGTQEQQEVNVIIAQVQRLMVTVREMHTTVDTHASCKANTKRSMIHRTKWATKTSKKIEDYRKKLANQSQSIKILLSSLNL
ncbi:hypothetical protein N0V82_005373 [Gnomoniopsis sp. IMI 355080]|nr:hypothetical protein N0V82_005373 [Gnomoniopsis sp. IMI 355080]